MSIYTPESPLPPGKLPNDLLELFLQQYQFEDSDLLIRPRVGEDIAAAEVAGDSIIVMKSDPITFATDHPGFYSVTVNANDVVTSGAKPRWFLNALMLPPGITQEEVRSLFAEIAETCRSYGITPCGGHTEITNAVSRPVISGMMIGTISKDRLVHKEKINPGDGILLTKALAVEAASIIAREFPGKLREGGFSAKEINACRHYLDKLSVIKEAEIITESGYARGMHDVTEGGLATAAEEFSRAAGWGFRIHMEDIPYLKETRKICSLLQLSPLGLIGSGSLIAVYDRSGEKELFTLLKEARIPAACIGEVLDTPAGIHACQNGEPAEWPRFDADEITKLF